MKAKVMMRGFTLVELMVVIGILAVLSGIMVAAFGGSSESARAAKCLANLRSLAQGANAIAMENGYYPFAGSVQHSDVSGSRVCYSEVRGWISWLSNKGDPFGHESGSKPTNPVSCESPRFYGFEDEDDNLFVITNGTMWRAVNMNHDIYRCPTHSLEFQRKNGGQKPLYSYVMNGYFGYDYSQGKKAVGWGYRREYGKLARADRILLFSELPMTDPESGELDFNTDKTLADSVLQAKATVNGKSYGKSWEGQAESIGFNHKAEKKGYCAHVAFADGHVETLSYGRGTGLKVVELTALLCNGKDVAFDGEGYSEIKETD